MPSKDISLKIEIKNKPLFIKNSLLVAAGIFLVSVSIWQLEKNKELTLACNNKSAELKDAKAVSKRLKKLHTRTEELAQKEKMLRIQAPVGETQPFSLIKTLSSLAHETGCRKTVFTIKEAGPADGQNPDVSGQPENIMEQPAEDMGMQEIPQGPSQEEYTAPAIPLAAINSLRLVMRFEGTYAQLISFLKKVRLLERLVSVEQIRITRKKELIPYQSISLQLTAYSFPKE